MTDDLDDILGDGRQAEVEARFRELEQQEELERMRRGEAPTSRRSRSRPASGAAASDDDLADLKSKLGGDAEDAEDAGRDAGDDDADDAAPNSAGERADTATAETERYVLILCPNCSAKNRTSLTKVRTRLPRCGACKASLSFTKL